MRSIVEKSQVVQVSSLPLLGVGKLESRRGSTYDTAERTCEVYDVVAERSDDVVFYTRASPAARLTTIRHLNRALTDLAYIWHRVQLVMAKNEKSVVRTTSNQVVRIIFIALLCDLMAFTMPSVYRIVILSVF